jgi:hypothetical protein
MLLSWGSPTNQRWLLLAWYPMDSCTSSAELIINYFVSEMFVKVPVSSLAYGISLIYTYWIELNQYITKICYKIGTHILLICSGLVNTERSKWRRIWLYGAPICARCFP